MVIFQKQMDSELQLKNFCLHLAKWGTPDNIDAFVDATELWLESMVRGTNLRV
ncbi:MAG: hypothetical protein Ct9H300mP28_36040 [Pseudomonadota bacterium]|nr:MAG: hypothetical protein Ct9H300mP28_36040 [Pseudomonadota bacterium]